MRGVKFLQEESGLMYGADYLDRNMLHTALDDVKRWLGFTNSRTVDDGYFAALIIEKRAIFKRATR